MENTDKEKKLKLLKLLKLKAEAEKEKMKMQSGKDRITDFGEKIGGSAKDRVYNNSGNNGGYTTKREKPIYYGISRDGAIYASYYVNNNLKGKSYYLDSSVWWKKHGKPYFKVFELEEDDKKKFFTSGTRDNTYRDATYNNYLTTIQIGILLINEEKIKAAARSILEQHANDTHEKPVYLHFRIRRADRSHLCYASYSRTYQRKGLNVLLFDTQKPDDYNRIFGGDPEELRKRWQESPYSTYQEFLNNVVFWEYINPREEELKAQARQMLGEGFSDKNGMVATHRYGTDWLKGRNATEKDFLDTFGFRAVEFGETMPQKERREHMNRAYEAFMDLTHVCGFSPSAIAHGGTLALAFGSRGKGGNNAASAHYEPAKNVINLTRRAGAGCLAHEWWHSLDRNLLENHVEIKYATDISSPYNGDQLDDFFNDTTGKKAFYLLSAIKDNILKRSMILDRNKNGDYWTKPTEMAARSFEAYVIHKMRNEGLGKENKPYENEYLAQIPAYNDTMENWYPYPKDDEIGDLAEKFDEFFATLKEEAGNRRNTALRGSTTCSLLTVR